MDLLAPNFHVLAADSYGAGKGPAWPADRVVSMADEAALWMGAGAWKPTPEPRKPAIAQSVANVRGWGHALFTEPAPLQDFTTLNIPVLCLVVANSPPSSRGVARLLSGVLPRGEIVELAGLAHRGLVTDPQAVNDAIARFAARG